MSRSRVRIPFPALRRSDQRLSLLEASERLLPPSSRCRWTTSTSGTTSRYHRRRGGGRVNRTGLGGFVAAVAAVVCVALVAMPGPGPAGAAAATRRTVAVVPLAMREGNGEQLLHLRFSAPTGVSTSLTYRLERGTARP